MKKIFSIFAALTLSVGLWAQKAGDTFVDATSGLKFYVTAVGETNTVKVMKNDYTGTSYTIPATVNYKDVDFAVIKIENFTFRECSSLQSVTILASVTTIGVSAFDGCSSLQSVTLPEGLLTIGDQAFFECESLQSLTIPASVTTIGAQAFYKCTGLTSVTFLGNACQEGIVENAFTLVGSPEFPALLTLPANWTGTKPNQGDNWYGGNFKLTAPAPVEGDQFVDATSGLKFQVTAVGEANTVKVIKNDYTGTSYTIPATVKYNDVDFAVTKIETSTFKECSSLLSVTLPEGLLTIGNYAFQECSSLQSVTIPASVTTIGAYAFKDCSSLQSVTLSEGLLTIVDGAFYGCSSLQSITIPAGVTTIGANAFCECTGLTSVTFLGNACQNAIGDMAFYNVGISNPATLVLPADWTGTKPDEDGRWYDGYFKLTAPAPVEGDQFVDATSGLKFEVTAVGEANTIMVIKNNYSGTSYTVPAMVSYNGVEFAVTEIGEAAFFDCESLQSVTLSEGLLTIGKDAFEDCSALVSINIPAGVTTIDTAAFYGCAFTSINLPASVTTLESNAFFGCKSLQSVTLSEGLLTIGQMAFAMTGLTSITIPASVTEIGMYAFYASSGLTSVTFLGNACQNNIGEDAFYNVGNPDPALLTLPNSWTGTLPDEDGNWYGGKFELSEEPSGWVNVNVNADVNKYLYNGQMIIRKGDKLYNAVGAEL